MNPRSIALILLMSLFAITGYAQTLIDKGDAYFEQKDYQKALGSYFQALRQDQKNAFILFKIGYTYLQSETKGQAVSFLDKAYKIDPTVDSKILYYLGMAYQSDLQYTKAKYVYEQYKKVTGKKNWDEIDQRIKQCIVSHGLISNPIDVLIENAGSFINSTYDDYSPVVTADESVMFFTSNRILDTLKKSAKAYEDIYISKKVNDEWAPAEKIGSAINMGHHDAVSSLSPDGKLLFLYYDLNHGDIYTSLLNDKGEWEKPLPLNKNINTSLFQETSASVSTDGKRLVFASAKPGGKGGLDIYTSTLDETGNWGKATSIGDEVNTPGNEDSPFLHPDGKTLYFSSDGHPGMGSSDIFVSSFIDGKWTKVENLGYPINSIEYDGFFTISEDKVVAHFSSKRKYGVGGYDILMATYRNVGDVQPVKTPDPVVATKPVAPTTPVVVATTPAATKPKKDAVATVKPKVEKNVEPVAPVTPPPAPVVNVFTVQGKAFDKKSLQPLTVSITLVDTKTKRQVASLESNGTSGSYELKIVQNGTYSLTAECKGYLYNTVNVVVAPSSSAAKKMNFDFSMDKAELGSVMVLNNLFFDTGKADLKPSSILELEKIRKLLLANPNLKVQINGHTDNVGDPAANKTLSLRRALAVVNHLALNGIDFDRLSAKGYGSEKPIFSNEEEKGGREFNRRTEIEIVDTTMGEKS